MPLEVVPSPVSRFFDLSFEELRARLQKLGWPAFRATQVWEWVYVKLASGPDEMTNLSKLDRAKLGEILTFPDSDVTRRLTSEDGTDKLLLTWPGGANAETVMIPDADRRTACVSSQVGCPVGCKFCASGLEGMKGNLSAGQIVEQVWRLNKFLSASVAPASTGTRGTRLPIGSRITNVVFMGMGEPLSNYANVMKAIRILHDPAGFNIGVRRITVSTVGVAPKMRELAHEDLPLNLAVSLHAPTESLRRELIPWAEHFSIDEILNAARYYFDKTGREITLEYILLSGVNDRAEHARQLAKVCRTLRANVNLIRYNQVTSLPFKRPLGEDVVVFQDILRNAGVNTHVRKSRGRDIDAACGQLRRNEEQNLITLGLPVAT